MKLITRVINALLLTGRLLLGPTNVCIYFIHCPSYARCIIKTKPWYIALPLITLRLLSCNPLTALFRYLWKKITTA